MLLLPICFRFGMKLTKANLAKLTFPAGKTEHVLYDEDLAGFGLRMHPGGRRTWFVQYRLGQKQRRLKIGTADQIDAEEARRKAKAALAKVHLGVDPALETEEAKAQAAITLTLTVEDYLARYASKRLKPGSLAEVERHLRRHWKPLGERPLVSIKRASVARRLADITRDNGPFAANRARAALSALFNWSIGEGFVDANPVAGTHLPTEEVKRDRVLSDNEVALVWQNAGVGDYGIIVRLLLLTAARRDEVGAMAWSELQGETWTVPGDRTKNGRPHELILPPAAMALLTSQPVREDRDLVFGSRAGPFSGWSKAKIELDARILAALKSERGTRATLDPWRLHDLRRTAATRMGDLGVQPHVVEAVLNHVSGSKAGVAGIYNRAAYREEKRAALRFWAERVADLTRGSNG